MSRAFTVRRWATWLFFASSLIAIFVAGQTNSMFMDLFGQHYPMTLAPRLPVATQQLLQNSWIYISWPLPVAAIAVAIAYLVMRKVRSQEAAYHYLALLTLVLYHFAFMSITLFTVIYFLLPRASAGT